MERDGGIEPPTLAWKAKVIPFYESRKIFGAPRQNRTAITGLQNQCTAIVLVGRDLQDVFDLLSIARWILARCLGLALSNIFVSCATFSGPSLGLPL